MSAAITAIAGSAILGAVSSRKVAKAQKSAARDSRQMSQDEAERGMNRLGSAGWGYDANEDMLVAAIPINGNAKHDKDILAARARLDAKFGNAWDVMTRAGTTYSGELSAAEGGQRRLSRQLAGLAAGAEGAGADLEARNSAVINRNADRALRNANQQTQASMGLFGPSTFTAQALAGNARQVNEQRSDALLNNSQQAFGNFQQARGNRINLLNTRGNADAAMSIDNAGRRYQVAQAPTQMRLGLLGTSPFHPFLGANTSQYFSGASPSANAMASGAGALGTFGGYLLGGGGGGGGGGSGNWAGGNSQGMPWSFA